MAVFWACGVTPQVAIMRAALPLCITHKPGQMLITDISDTAENPMKTAKQLKPIVGTNYRVPETDTVS